VRRVTRHPDGLTAAWAPVVLAGWFRSAPAAGTDLLDRMIELDRVDVWPAAADRAGHPAVWTVDPGLPDRLAGALIERLARGRPSGAAAIAEELPEGDWNLTSVAAAVGVRRFRVAPPAGVPAAPGRSPGCASATRAGGPDRRSRAFGDRLSRRRAARIN
jgi:hypothetical protein